MAVENSEGQENDRKLGRLVIITGVTASGKTEIKNALEERGVKRIVTATTRPPREGEKPGVDYHFISSREKFEEMAQGNQLIEWVEYNGNYYGTPKSELEPLFLGQDLITSTEIQGAVDFQQGIGHSYDQQTASLLLSRSSLVFIGVESLHVAKSRFLGREIETAGHASNDARNNLRNRLRSEWQMWNQHQDKFNHVIINRSGQLDQTVEEVARIYLEK